MVLIELSKSEMAVTIESTYGVENKILLETGER